MTAADDKYEKFDFTHQIKLSEFPGDTLNFILRIPKILYYLYAYNIILTIVKKKNTMINRTRFSKRTSNASLVE